jgi:exodeoxyribonuclease VII large subunit
MIDSRAADVAADRDRARRCLAHRLDAAAADLAHTRARVTALSPQSTLDRGYAVVQSASGGVLRDPAEVTAGDELRIRLAAGNLSATARP